MKKTFPIIILISLIIAGLAATVKPSSVISETKTYTAADIIEINEQAIAVVPNGTGVETLLITADNEIRKLAEAVPGGDGIQPQGVYTRFENGRPVAYVAAGNALQKYDISSPSWPALAKSVASPVGTARDVVGRDDVNLILLAGENGVKELETTNLSAIRDIWTLDTYGLAINNNGEISLNTAKQGVTLNRQAIAEYVVNLTHNQPALKKPYLTSKGTGFVADDEGIKKIGAEVKFNSPSGFGYSIDALADDDYIYFVNGWGIYKLDKSLNQIDFQTINLIDGWAVSLRVFKAYGKTKILVLASDRIYLLNDNLSILDIYTYQPMRNLKNISIDDDASQLTKASQASPAGQPLRVRVSQAPVSPGDIIKVYATGYYAGEPLTLELGTKINEPDKEGRVVTNPNNLIEKTIADGNGNAVIEHIVIPKQSYYPIMVNIRVYGENSTYKYTLALQVIEPKAEEEKVEIKNLETHIETVTETETTREVTEEEQSGKTIIHEIIHTVERAVERAIAELEIKDGQIAIQRGRISPATYVRWINKDSQKHSVKSIEVPKDAATFDSGNLEKDGEYQFKFEDKGTYKYVIDGKADIIYEIIVE